MCWRPFLVGMVEYLLLGILHLHYVQRRIWFQIAVVAIVQVELSFNPSWRFAEVNHVLFEIWRKSRGNRDGGEVRSRR